ncbi:hypothetical protein BKA59DRAFT_509652 [Fusarium tricinctum]|uniref:Uncharacterized protein n=1 Tax=Fusarium tricinctum TaxID=61284 RepID=A0A8K0RWZ0_9HYPO|nr:hypothetical protein BKA59DRAFT_509652 [Fusarium tricinctum]
MLVPSARVIDYKPKSDASTNGKEKSSNEDLVNHQRVLEFWNKVWPSRIQEIKEELAATWSPDPKVLEDLGVSLGMMRKSMTMNNQNHLKSG